MARSTTTSRPGVSLAALVGILALLFGLIGAGVIWSNAQWTPKLALDLEGGTQIVLTPVPQESGRQLSATDLQQAVGIIRQRVNASGVSEAEVTTQGSQNIIVALPGNPDQATRDRVKQSAQLQFRAVLAEAAGSPQATPTPSATGSPSASPTGSGARTPTPSATAGTPKASASASTSSNGMALPRSVQRALGAATTPSPTGSPAASASPTAKPSATPAAKPSNASDLAWVTAEIAKKFQALDCSTATAVAGGVTPDPAKPFVACSKSGDVKYILGPAEVLGTDISKAAAAIGTTSQGLSTGEWEVDLTFTSGGAKKFGAVTQRLYAISQDDPRNQFGIVLDGLVISAPRTLSAIPGGSAQITGNFTQQTATDLANQLKFGALPVSFRVETEDRISALLGGEQLRRGLLAGLIGLALVVLYSLAQYRALGMVTIASLMIAGMTTYGLVVLMGWRQGFRLSLPGVAGLIVSIGITADSFIVYFERVRDEVRDGRALRAAVDTAWLRARRTIMASDTVSFLAALVLFILAVGGVRGFAFTLGLTTIVDILVVFLFTHPVVTLLARTRFFGGGHRLSGFDAEHLGRQVVYAGAGRIRPPTPAARTGRTTIAERRAAAERAERADAEGDASGRDHEQAGATRRDG